MTTEGDDPALFHETEKFAVPGESPEVAALVLPLPDIITNWRSATPVEFVNRPIAPVEPFIVAMGEPMNVALPKLARGRLPMFPVGASTIQSADIARALAFWTVAEKACPFVKSCR